MLFPGSPQTEGVCRGIAGSAAKVTRDTQSQLPGPWRGWGRRGRSNETEGESAISPTVEGPVSSVGAQAHGREEGQPQGRRVREHKTKRTNTSRPQSWGLSLSSEHWGPASRGFMDARTSK